MGENEIMTNDNVVDEVAEVAVTASKNPFIGVAAGAVAIVVVGGIALLWNKWGKYQFAEKKTAREAKKNREAFVVVEDDSTDSDTTE